LGPVKLPKRLYSFLSIFILSCPLESASGCGLGHLMVLRDLIPTRNQWARSFYFEKKKEEEEETPNVLLGIKINYHNFRRNVGSYMSQLWISAKDERAWILRWQRKQKNLSEQKKKK
jgi:hypothetical protein